MVPGLRVLYDYAWFVGFAIAFALYAALMRGTPVVDLSRVPEAGDGEGAARSLRPRGAPPAA